MATTKPIIVLKGGKLGSSLLNPEQNFSGVNFQEISLTDLADHDKVLSAVFERCGILQVDTLTELFYMADGTFLSIILLLLLLLQLHYFLSLSPLSTCLFYHFH